MIPHYRACPASLRAGYLSADGAGKWLAVIAVGNGRERFGPVTNSDPRTKMRRPSLPIPPNLLHVVVELQRVAIGIRDERGIPNTGEKFRRQLADGAVLFSRKSHRVFELPVVGYL